MGVGDAYAFIAAQVDWRSLLNQTDLGMNSRNKDRAATTQQAACSFFSFSFVAFLEI